MPKISPNLEKFLKEYDLNPKDALWECHGQFVIYHKYLEIVIREAKIKFDPPIIIEADGANKVAAICVVGRMEAGEKNFSTMEWSIGEASPLNYQTKGNQPAFPWAVAEKRAKDRTALKLLGVHGLIYSEEEADDFKPKTTYLDPREGAGVLGPVPMDLVSPIGEVENTFTDPKEYLTELANNLKDNGLYWKVNDHVVEFIENQYPDLKTWVRKIRKLGETAHKNAEAAKAKEAR